MTKPVDPVVEHLREQGVAKVPSLDDMRDTKLRLEAEAKAQQEARTLEYKRNKKISKACFWTKPRGHRWHYFKSWEEVVEFVPDGFLRFDFSKVGWIRYFRVCASCYTIFYKQQSGDTGGGY